MQNCKSQEVTYSCKFFKNQNHVGLSPTFFYKLSVNLNYFGFSHILKFLYLCRHLCVYILLCSVTNQSTLSCHIVKYVSSVGVDIANTILRI